jgi:hypothetical protein
MSGLSRRQILVAGIATGLSPIDAFAQTATLLHLAAVFDGGFLSHTRHSDDTSLGMKGWFPFTGHFPDFAQVACSVNSNFELQVCGIDGTHSTLVHAIRGVNDNWTPFRNVQDETVKVGPNRGRIGYVACATTSGDELHVCAIDQQNGLWHTIRRANGTWPFPLGDVQAETRKIGPNLGIGPTPRVACAVDSANNLHVCAIDQQNGLWHTLRRAEGAWPNAFGDVQAEIRKVGPNQGIGPTPRVACAASASGNLHVCAIDQQGFLWHTIRRSDGRWPFAFGDVQGQAGSIGLPLGEVTCSIARSSEELHLVVATRIQGQKTDGQIWYTRRDAQGAWRKFENLQDVLNTVPGALSIAVSAQ